MTDDALAFRSVAELRTDLRSRRLRCRDLVDLYLRRIDRLDPYLHAFITVTRQQAVAAADALDRYPAGTDAGPLAGIPVAVKDSIPTAGIRTTANSRVLEDWVPDRDAAAIEYLRAAGAIIIGKTNLNEFEWSIPSPVDLVPPPRNPWNPAYAAIGSSSGSAVAVAAGLCTAALGTDSGGSVRLPAGQTGLVGLKPTHALISRAGLLHGGSIGDIGLIARTVGDVAILLEALSCFDPDDPDSEPHTGSDYTAVPTENARGIRVGVPQAYIESFPLESAVRRAWADALAIVRDAGAVVVPVGLEVLEQARAALFVVLNAEHYAAHAASLGRCWFRYGASARLYHAQGAFVTAADYAAAMTVGRLARRSVDRVLSDVDVLLTPLSPVVTAEAARRPGVHRRGVNARFTAPFNLTGHPALALPVGASPEGLPVGVQIVGRRYDEATVLRVAHVIERATGWPLGRPPDQIPPYVPAGG